MFRDAFRTPVQTIGRTVSRWLFTDARLAHPRGKKAYLFLYRAFKRLFESADELKPYVIPGSTVLDIGANIGVTAASFRQMLGANGSVIAFEPDPIMADLFRLHIKKRQLDGIHLFPIALGDHDGTDLLFRNLSNRADNRLVLDATMGPTKQISIPVRTLSSVAQEHPSLFAAVSLIKIDVQGFEYRVLSGMADWLKDLAHKPVIHLELWPYGLKQAGSSADALLHLCHELGYVVTPDLSARAARMEGTKHYFDVTLVPRI